MAVCRATPALRPARHGARLPPWPASTSSSSPTWPTAASSPSPWPSWSPTAACELVSAGHGPTMLFPPPRAIEQFGGDGLPLAVANDQDYGPSRRFSMAPGDALVPPHRRASWSGGGGTAPANSSAPNASPRPSSEPPPNPPPKVKHLPHRPSSYPFAEGAPGKRRRHHRRHQTHRPLIPLPNPCPDLTCPPCAPLPHRRCPYQLLQPIPLPPRGGPGEGWPTTQNHNCATTCVPRQCRRP